MPRVSPSSRGSPAEQHNGFVRCGHDEHNHAIAGSCSAGSTSSPADTCRSGTQVMNSAVATLTGASQLQGQSVAGAAMHSGDVGPDGWPKMTPCTQKRQDKFTVDQQKQNADTSTSLEQMQEWADVCKSLGQ